MKTSIRQKTLKKYVMLDFLSALPYPPLSFGPGRSRLTRPEGNSNQKIDTKNGKIINEKSKQNVDRMQKNNIPPGDQVSLIRRSVAKRNKDRSKSRNRRNEGV